MAPRCGSSNTWTSAAPRTGRCRAWCRAREMLDAARGALRRRSRRWSRRRRRRPIATACRTARCSASSPRPPSRSVDSCDRSRLTADGLWYLCLYAAHGTDLRRPLRAGASADQLAQLIRATWEVRSDRGAEERLASARSLTADSGGSAEARSAPRDAHAGRLERFRADAEALGHC